jgi:hydroxymethylpyrimidine pyrophosphatase-like HAD family hydrolase
MPPATPDLPRIGEYVAKRVEALPLGRDPYFADPHYRWCGWDELTALLRRVYGPVAGRLHTRGIREHLRRNFAAPKPALVDGRMAPREWICDGTRLYKTDYEQHNFGGGELDLVDPAWDLAATIFEFDLAEENERGLVDAYLKHTEDRNLRERLLLHKLLYAAVAMRGALYWMSRNPVASNRRLIAARDFATFQMARHCGRHIVAAAQWTPRLFFLDLDGVLDWPYLGFPHTTPNGVRALGHLAAGGYAVVLNTLRSVRHVREYCRAYHLPGGVAEMGSVFWDGVRRIEVALTDAATLKQLDRVKEVLRKMPGVLFDDSYTYSIYAHRYTDGQPHGLSAAEVEQALHDASADQCGYVLKGSGTHIIQKDRSKAASVAQVRSYLNCGREPVVAIDDVDVGLLAAADIAYTPANGAHEIRGKCKRMRGRRQNGLLEAAVDLTGTPAAVGSDPESWIDTLLGVCDRRR